MTISKVALTLVLVASAGCIAQPGDPNGTDQTSSSSAALEQNSQASAPGQEQRQNAELRNQFQKPLLNNKQSITPNGGDPSQNSQDNGDGTEPDPHPWEPHAAVATQQQK